MTRGQEHTETDPARIEARLQAALGHCVDKLAPGDRIVVAFSGGLDSTVLLHALARLAPRQSVAAVHVDHGLHADSPRWAAHCARVAGELGIDCTVLTVDAAAAPGQSPEAAARIARYAAFEHWLGDRDTLVTAHHGDDQLETLLLRMLRGTGVRGLRAIRSERKLGRGRVVRPLLDFSRTQLAAVAATWGAAYIADPSNAELRFDRNYLRAEVLPPVRRRWPAAHRVASRLSRHMAEAEDLLEELAAIDCAGEQAHDRFPVERTLVLTPARRANLLRYLIRRCGLATPPERVLAELIRQLESAPGSAARVAWPGAEARLYRAQLYLLAALPPARPGPAGPLDPVAGWSGPEGRLELKATEAAGLPEHLVEAGLTVAFRRGGERFVPAGRRHHASLKHWFQAQGIVPWMRSRVPLLFAGDELVAVADLVIAEVPRRDAEPLWAPVWTAHPRVR